MKEVSKLIAWFTFILGVIALIGGIYVAIINVGAETKVDLLGQKISTTSVGLSLFFIGTVMILTTFKRILKVVQNIKEIPNDKLKKISFMVSEEMDNNKQLYDAQIKLIIKPEPLIKHTDRNGICHFYIDKNNFNKKINIIASKNEYITLNTNKTIKEDDLIKLELVPDKIIQTSDGNSETITLIVKLNMLGLSKKITTPYNITVKSLLKELQKEFDFRMSIKGHIIEILSLSNKKLGELPEFKTLKEAGLKNNDTIYFKIQKNFIKDAGATFMPPLK